MKIFIKPQKKLFVAYLLINRAGYDFENNPSGMHYIRKMFRQISADLYEQDNVFREAVNLIKNSYTNEQISPRIVNILSDRECPSLEGKDLQIFRAISTICESKGIDDLFNRYCEEIKKLKIKEFCGKEFSRWLGEVNEFFHLEKDIIDEIFVHINLLESYCRGTNYEIEGEKIISISLALNDQVEWRTVRHEYMHLLLKKIYKRNFKEDELKIPTSAQYASDSVRTKFDENFVIIANLFFTDQEARANNLKYFIDNSFSDSKVFYDFIFDNFLKGQKELNTEILDKLVKLIQEKN